VTLKPFCYYCDKEFNNELILHQHQKARHFNCVKCRKRFSTAPALDTHEIQVHRSSLKRVPNAKAGRDSFDISIYGMDGVPMELIKFKLAEKVEQKKRKLIKENKMVGNIEEKNGDKVLNYLDIKEQKDKDIRDLLMKTSEQGGEGFYHNPDSINLTLKQNQMKSMFINRPSQQNNISNLYGNNIDKNNIKEKNKNKEKDKEKKVKEKEAKNEKEKETGILSLEQLNKELD
jgi:hypothetical protein